MQHSRNHIHKTATLHCVSVQQRFGAVQSKYDASVPRFGIMGLVFAWVAELSEPCTAFPGTNNAVTTPYGSMFTGAGNCMMGVQFPSHDAAAVAAA